VQSCQGPGCTNFTTITMPTVTGSTYADLNVTPSTSYTYRVRAVDSQNNLSPFSNLATVVTAP
jgi:chitodextrinase